MFKHNTFRKCTGEEITLSTTWALIFAVIFIWIRIPALTIRDWSSWLFDWFGLVLWHINHFRLLTVKISLFIYPHHHHHVVSLARISLTLSRHFSLSFIASDWCSGLHPVSLHSCWMYVRAGRPAFARSYVGVHRSTSLMSSSLLLQQCPACLVRLTWIVFVMGGRWPYSWCLLGCCH